MKHTFFSRILPSFVLFMGLCLVLGGCNTTSSPTWRAGSGSVTAPENLLLEKEILSAGDSNQVWFTEDGSLITRQDILTAEATPETAGRETLPSVEIGNLQDAQINPVLRRSEVKSYMRDDRVVQGRVVPLSALRDVQKVKVAILLPLSGEHKNVGQAILNAAQLAMFDVAGKYFELMPRDTQGTPEGARNAASSAINSGAELILGPLFSSDVEAVKPVARQKNIPVITFSTDWKVADNNTFVMGFHPFDQVQRVMGYAASQGLKRQAILAPYTPYGDVVTNAFRNTVRRVGAQSVMVERYRVGDDAFNDLVKKFTDYDRRKAHKDELKKAISAIEAIPARQRNESQNSELARLKLQSRDSGLPFDAVMLPMGGTEVHAVASTLKYYDVDITKARFLGTGLWDDPSVLREISMIGAWYAAPPPSSWENFRKQYRSVYGAEPVRIASLGYDATALVAVLARQGIARQGRPDFNYQSLTNPSGFAGIDGIFRFGRNGLAERGLAVMEITQNGPQVISPAPSTFQEIIN